MGSPRKFTVYALLLCSFCFAPFCSAPFCSTAFAHAGHKHPATGPLQAPAPLPPNDPRAEVYARINRSYLEQLKPLLQSKCFDCHSGQTMYPSYYAIPGIKWMIDRDIRIARSHIDFSKDFPFISHATPMEDLKALREDAEEDDMPPLLYRWTHAGSKLNDDDKKKISAWTAESEELMRSIGEK